MDGAVFPPCYLPGAKLWWPHSVKRYKHLNAEFQRIARRDRKAFLSDPCKEIEENYRMGKTRDLQENQRYQGNISCKGEHNKGQKWYGLNKSRRY